MGDKEKNNLKSKNTSALSDEARKLQNDCNNLKRILESISQQFYSRLNEIWSSKTKDVASCPQVLQTLNKTINRSREFENGTFIVLMVGPVKSGKSTLVNLIANAYVSPTHFWECTIRPSIISQRHEGMDSKITVFTSRNTTNRVEQIDAIVDCIRGIDNESSLVDITKSEFELSRDTIKEKVELGLNESLSSETLVTSITTPGGKLLKQNVFIIDMPGFDGAYANINDPVYDTIAQRADLIIFVQSSNSAISSVSGQFLEKLSNNNNAVPVCLIHNIFDSSWWRPKEERDVEMLDQRGFAITEIRKKGFSIDERQCFSINLGKVEDGRKEEYVKTPTFKEEIEKYEHMEDELYTRVINRRDAMRLKVCLSRTHQQLKKTIAAIDEELSRRRQLSEQYEHVISEFSKSNDNSRFKSALSPMKVDYSILKKIIFDEARRRILLISADNNNKSDEEVGVIVNDFIKACEERISASLGESMSIALIEEKLLSICKNRFNEISGIIVNLGAQPTATEIKKISIEEIPNVSLLSGVDFNLLIPHRRRFMGFGGHSAEAIVSYINRAAENFTGSVQGDKNYTIGYLEIPTGAIKPILDKVNSLLEDVAEKYEKICEDFWEQSKDSILYGIIENKDFFDAETEQLENLRYELSTTDMRCK